MPSSSSTIELIQVARLFCCVAAWSVSCDPCLAEQVLRLRAGLPDHRGRLVRGDLRDLATAVEGLLADLLGLVRGHLGSRGRLRVVSRCSFRCRAW